MFAQCGLLVNCSHQYVGSLGSKGHIIRVILTALKAQIDELLFRSGGLEGAHSE